MKKNVTFLLALLVIFTGCGNTDTSDTTDTSNKEKKIAEKTSSKEDNSTMNDSSDKKESSNTDAVADSSSADTASTDNSTADTSNTDTASTDNSTSDTSSTDNSTSDTSAISSNEDSKLTCSEASKLVIQNQGMGPTDPIPATWDNQDGTFTVHLSSRTLMSQGSAYGTVGIFLVKKDGSVINVSDDPTYPKPNAEMCN